MSAPSETKTKTISDSLRRLKLVQKPSAGAPFYTLYINRPLGRFFAACAHQLNLTPNHVTAVSALFTYTGIVALAWMAPGWAAAVVVTVALMIGYALDASDGQLSRLRGGGSLSGEWLDHLIDAGKSATLHLAVLITAYRHFDVPSWYLFVPIGFSVVYVIFFVGLLLTDLLGRVNSARTGAVVAASEPSRVRSIVKLPTDYGLQCIMFLLLAVPDAFVVVYSLFAVGVFAYTALALPTWYSKLKTLDHAH